MFMTDNHTKQKRQPARRGLLAAGCAFAGLGAWVAWQKPEQAVADSDSGLAEFWASQWLSPSGDKLLTNRYASRPLLVNFWATWCPPCVEELPLLDAFLREQRVNGWQMLAIAADKPDAVIAFLKQHPVSFDVAVAGTPAIDWSRRLGNAASGLPYTAVFASDGSLARTKAGQVQAADLAGWRNLR